MGITQSITATVTGTGIIIITMTTGLAGTTANIASTTANIIESIAAIITTTITTAAVIITIRDEEHTARPQVSHSTIKAVAIAIDTKATITAIDRTQGCG